MSGDDETFEVDDERDENGLTTSGGVRVQIPPRAPRS